MQNIDTVKLLLIEKINPTLWSIFINRKYIYDRNIKFPTETSMGEDVATLLSIFISKPNISIEKALYNYYQRSDSITKK